MKLRAYIIHKNSEKYSDCADYFGICPQQKRVAVSDGVSQSIMPLEWAKIIVSAFIDGSWDPNHDIRKLQDKWLEEANEFLDLQRSQGENPWMLENCLIDKDGAGATFCGVTFKDQCHWNASILGDSCVVLINEANEIVEIISSKDGLFDNKPDYFDSFKEKRGIVKNVSGELKANQKLLLVSDPFSELFQKKKDTEEALVIIEKLLSINTYEDYSKLVPEFRSQYHMHDDDSTLIIIEYDGSPDITIDDNSETLETLIENERQSEQANVKSSDKNKDHTNCETDKVPQDSNGIKSIVALSSPDANRHEGPNPKSSGSSKGTEQENPSEDSAEDDDRCGQKDDISNDSLSCGENVGKGYQADKSSDSTPSKEERTTGSTDEDSQKAKTADTQDPQKGENSGHPEEVEKKVENEDDEKTVSVVGKCQQEFFKMLPTASKLFVEKYYPDFADMQSKWRNNPQELFAQFWGELVNLI